MTFIAGRHVNERSQIGHQQMATKTVHSSVVDCDALVALKMNVKLIGERRQAVNRFVLEQLVDGVHYVECKQKPVNKYVNYLSILLH